MRIFIILIVFNCSYCLSVSAQEQGKLRLATYVEPPMIALTKDHYHGEFIDIMQLLASELNLQLEFVPCPVARCFSMIQSGHTDIIIGIKHTSQREKYLSYLEPHFYTQDVPLNFFTIKKSSVKIDNYQDLKNKLIGVQRGAAFFPQFDHDQSLKKIYVTQTRQLIDMLLKERIDTFIERTETIFPLLKGEELSQLKIQSYSYNQQVKGYIALSKKSRWHQDKVRFSQTLKRLIAQGKLEGIFAKYQLHHH
jgi:ABC-type amino acid transport substrate-binding protein